MEKRKVTINGTVYNIDEELDFSNVASDFEDKGVDVVSLLNGETRYTFSFARAFVSLVTGLPAIAAGKLLTKHMANGGNLLDMMEVFRGLMIDAGFGNAETATEEVTPQTEAAPEQEK